MTYPPLRQQRLADGITERLEAMILEGSLKPGQRLPPERELAERFGFSRPSLREAIQKLAARGLLASRQGGGTFVNETLNNGYTDPLLEMLSRHNEFHLDLLEFRDAMEGISAYYAARAPRLPIKPCLFSDLRSLMVALWGLTRLKRPS